MTRLNCSSKQCVYNEGGLCSAERIEIQGFTAGSSVETFCNTFIKDSVKEEFKAALTNTNYSGEIMQIFSSWNDIKMNPEVHCNAVRCFYNNQGMCGAKDISIRGDYASNVGETLCETFVE